MTTYVIPTGGEAAVDRTKLEYPCKIVDLEGGEEYYYNSAESTKVRTSAVLPEIIDRLIDANDLKDAGDGEFMLGVETVTGGLNLITLKIDSYGVARTEIISTIDYPSGRGSQFSGIGYFYIDGYDIVLKQATGNGLDVIGQGDILVEQAIDDLMDLFGTEFGENTLVTPSGYRMAKFTIDTDDGHVTNVIVYQPFIPKMTDAGNGEVMVRVPMGTYGRIDGTSYEATRFAWMVPGTDEYGNVVFTTPAN